MIIIDIKMPKSCRNCPMPDSEFMYCHAKEARVWNVENYMDNNVRPDWCPLIEVKDNAIERNN